MNISVHPRVFPGGVLPCSLLLLGTVFPASAQSFDPNACDAPGDVPNVIVGNLHQIQRWGHVGEITAFSVGTTSCNVGTCWLDWITGGNDPRHPCIGGNAYRLMDGRIEQLGQSWLKHGFYALSQDVCSPDCLPTDGEHLGVNCSDPYSSDLNGQQTRLGPKFEVNTVTGEHPHPVSMQGLTGDEIFKRLQIHDRDLDPALNAGARYFVEGQYVSHDDAAAGNQHDNASYREVAVIDNGPANFDLAFAGSTQRTRPGILAWVDNDSEVQSTFVEDSDGGGFWLAAKATDLGTGTWHYEHAVQNLDSYRGAGWFSVPVAASLALSNAGFHDVDYHSGEPFDLTDWNSTRDQEAGAILWNTVPHGTNPNANALRWGTLYNFRFDADAPPAPTLVTLGLFRPGSAGDPRRLVAVLMGPSACNGDGACDPGESCLSCPGDCDASLPDSDGDGLGFCEDCDDNSPKHWGTPGEVGIMKAHRVATGEVVLDWQESPDPGCAQPVYEVLRSALPSDFLNGPACLSDAVPTSRGLTDIDAATTGPFLNYLVRARSLCAQGLGTTGYDSFARERVAAVCP